MSDPDVINVTVEYRDAEPQSVEVKTARWSSDFRYCQRHKFKMEGSTAELVVLEGDGEQYNVRANTETRTLAKETVENLPFVQGVVMIE